MHLRERIVFVYRYQKSMAIPFVAPQRIRSLRELPQPRLCIWCCGTRLARSQHDCVHKAESLGLAVADGEARCSDDLTALPAAEALGPTRCPALRWLWPYLSLSDESFKHPLLKISELTARPDLG